MKRPPKNLDEASNLPDFDALRQEEHLARVQRERATVLSAFTIEQAAPLRVNEPTVRQIRAQLHQRLAQLLDRFGYRPFTATLADERGVVLSEALLGNDLTGSEVLAVIARIRQALEGAPQNTVTEGD